MSAAFTQMILQEPAHALALFRPCTQEKGRPKSPLRNQVHKVPNMPKQCQGAAGGLATAEAAELPPALEKAALRRET